MRETVFSILAVVFVMTIGGIAIAGYHNYTELQPLPAGSNVLVEQVAGMGTVDVPLNTKNKPNGKIYRVSDDSTGEVCYVSTYGNKITALFCFPNPNWHK
jgi:hypothetical protein